MSIGEFSLDDKHHKMTQMGKLGSLGKIMSLIPGMSQMQKMMGDVDHEKDFRRLRGIIDSMTADERRNPSRIVDQSRRRRSAAGAGVEPTEVNQLVKQFDGMAAIMKSMSGKGVGDRMKAMRELQGQMMNPNAGGLMKAKVGTGKRLTSEERNKLKKQRE